MAIIYGIFVFSFKLFLKLFCVMGVTWIFEVVSFLHVGTDIPWYWNIVDSVNVCQAIAVFIIYVCKKETVFALRKTYPALKGKPMPFEAKICHYFWEIVYFLKEI